MGDTLYVADWGNKRVVALTTDLTFKFSFRKGVDAMEPCGIAASDKELFVSDQAAHQLHVFSPTGEFLRSIGANGTQPGQFKSPCGVTYIGGILFVAEYVGRRVQALETDGTPLQVCSSSLGPVCSSLAPAVGARPLAYASDAPLPRLRASQVLPVVDATSLYDLCVVRPQPRTASCTLYVTGAPLAPPRNWHRSARSATRRTPTPRAPAPKVCTPAADIATEELHVLSLELERLTA